MSRRTYVILISVLACCALALAILAMAFLFFPKRHPWVLLRGYSLIMVIGLAVAVVVGHAIASLALSIASREAADRENRLRSFLSDTGHELRTPLAVIAASLEVFGKSIPPADLAAATLYDGVRQETERLTALVQDVLLLARLDTVRISAAKPIDIDALISDLATETRLRAPAVSIETELSSGATLIINETELRDALRNLIDNALKYGRGAPVTLKTARHNGTACIEVSDKGPGMDSEDCALAFERYYRGTTSEGTQGTGLGLAIVQSVAERAGGTATLASEPGIGTTVSLTFPISSASAHRR